MKGKTVGTVLYILFSLIILALFEFNKNTLAGWAVAIVLLILYPIVRLRKPFKNKKLLRIPLFLLLCAALGAALKFTEGPVKLRDAVEGNNGGVTEIVEVAQGQLTGVYTEDKQVEVYTGIPYAAPPVGDLRWKEPADPESWEGVRACDKFAPMSMQVQSNTIYSSLSRMIGYHDYKISLKDNFKDANSEDALYLNIWKPAGKADGLPVLVYIHGGTLQTGQPWYADYSGDGLARKGVIVVNMGYRLGVFGFLATDELAAESVNGTTGNYGLLDQIKALEWVRDNIAAFGGDPDNVTVAGESAGSACVTALCTSPLAEGLFKRAIAESSTVTAVKPTHSFRSYEDALKCGRETLARFRCDSIEELRKVDAEALAEAMDTNHHMTVDGYVLTEDPYLSMKKGICNADAFLEGFNSEESAPFILFSQANSKNYEDKVRAYFGEYADEVLKLFPAETSAEARRQWAEIYSAVFFTYGHWCLTNQANALDIPAYEYFFCKHNGSLGPWHSGEMIYCYGNIPKDSRLYDEADRELSDIFCSYFANFCKTGDPNGEDLPLWERSSTGNELLKLGDSVEMIRDPFLKIYPVFDRFYGAS